MDPVSIGYGVLSTSFKEIMALHQSYVAARGNREDLERLAKLIEDSVNEMKAVLPSEEVAQGATLFHLIENLDASRINCLELVPSEDSSNRFERIRNRIRTWMRGKELNRRLNQIRHEMESYHDVFQTSSLARTERMVEAVARKLNISDVVDTSVVSTELTTTADNIGSEITVSTQISTQSHTLSPDDISYVFLLDQLNNINTYLNQMFSGQGLSFSLDAFPPSQLLHLPPTSNTVFCNMFDRKLIERQVIALALDVQASLSGHRKPASFQSSSQNIANLCYGLCRLGLYSQAITIAVWAVNLCRAWAETDSTIYHRYLPASLRLLSEIYLYSGSDNLSNAEDTINDAIFIGRKLLTGDPSNDAEVNALLGTLLLQLSCIMLAKDKLEASSNFANDTITVYENIVTKDQDVSEGNVSSPITETTALSLRSREDGALCRYVHAMIHSSMFFWSTHQFERVFKTAVKALDMLLQGSQHTLCDQCNGTHQISVFLSQLCSDEVMSLNLLDEYKYLEYAQNCVKELRVFHKQSEDRDFRGELCTALKIEAQFLKNLKQYDAAISDWKEISTLAYADTFEDHVFRSEALFSLVTTLSSLARYEEAATYGTQLASLLRDTSRGPSGLVAEQYFDNGMNYFQAGMYPEASRELQECLLQLRMLVSTTDENVYHTPITVGVVLNRLVHIQFHNKEYAKAFQYGGEALRFFSVTMKSKPTQASHYVDCLTLNFKLTVVVDLEQSIRLERTQTCLEHAQRLAEQYPDKYSMVYIDSINHHTKVLMSLDRLEDALTSIQHGLSWFNRHPAEAPDEVVCYIKTLTSYSNVLHVMSAPGRKDIPTPLDALDKAIEIGSCHPTNDDIYEELIMAMNQRVVILGDLGRYAEASIASKKYETFARMHFEEHHHEYISCLQHCALASRNTGDYDAALGYISEALQLSLSCGDGCGNSERGDIYLFLSHVLGDVGNDIEAAQTSERLLKSIQSLEDSEEAYHQPRYINALEVHAMHKASKGLVSDALEAIQKVRVYYEARTAKRRSSFPSLARALYLESTFNCALGKHEEGISLNAKFKELELIVSREQPEIAKRARRYVDKYLTFPSTISMLSKLNITCNHHSL
ncbi:hypothetical protein JR316_0012731 [Psilocybe cubensis]|uniref:Uncharacterized protein n=2 Tax=Psilocybe cubensis TaxID=181762 RepID=A0ACB8GJ33_PSICU|nr:hypothetical protein JR316_0012731 [Psilocybe cubensis]KAH9475614.1 hypothetical protein JR316_0012731 [Psilocybe cubensis]